MNAAQMEDLGHVKKFALTPMDHLIAAVKAVIIFRDQIALVWMCKIVPDWYTKPICFLLEPCQLTVIALIPLFTALNVVHTNMMNMHTYI